MPKKAVGVYEDGRGHWYFKVTIGKNPLTGEPEQVTRRGFATASEAASARREFLSKVDDGTYKPSASPGVTIAELMALYLDGLDADLGLSEKTRFDYRKYSDSYVVPHLGKRKVRDITPEVVLAWQRKLAKDGGVKDGRPLKPNTVRLARAPLAGALKLACTLGIRGTNPMGATPRPAVGRSIPKHWTPEQARDFLALMDGDRMWTTWAILLNLGPRIGECVWLEWSNVDLKRMVIHVVHFASTLGRELRPSQGKSKHAVRTVDFDESMARVFRRHRLQQAQERLAANDYVETNYVFTKPGGGPYHPQDLSRMLASDSKSAGLPRLTAHGLRHTCATLMLANGVPPKVAAERLGHADPTLFMNLYSHVTPTMQKEAAKSISSSLFG